MKLVGPSLSGYTRRVGVTLNLLNIPFEHLHVDSGAIVDYLKSVVPAEQRLMPVGGPERVRAMQSTAFSSTVPDLSDLQASGLVGTNGGT